MQNVPTRRADVIVDSEKVKFLQEKRDWISRADNSMSVVDVCDTRDTTYVSLVHDSCDNRS